METLRNLLSQEIVQRLGWTLVHFVWQGIAIGLLLAVVLKLLHKSSANLRYMLACMALVLIVAMPAVTIRMVNVSILGINQAGIDLLKASSNVQVAVEMPQIEMPQVGSLSAPVIVMPEVTLQDRFVRAVESALPYVVVGWFIGVFGLSLWYLGGWTQLQRLRRQMVSPVSERVHLRLRRLSEQMGLKRVVAIMESALVAVPTVVGHLKPVILLPASALTGLSAEQIEAILAHELAHIKRCDYLVNMLQTVVEILGFYHPAVWWVSQKIRIERENCCDDMAVGVSGDRISYAKALASMEEIRARQLPLAVAASGGSLFDRVGRLLGKDSANEGKLSWLPSVVAMLLIAGLLIPTALALSPKSKTDLNSARKSDLVHLVSVAPEDMTIERLADICEGMESAIIDVAVDYEWYYDPPAKTEDIAGTGTLMTLGHEKLHWSTARPCSERSLTILSANFTDGSHNNFHGITKQSFNGKIGKYLQIVKRPDKPESTSDGTITKSRRFMEAQSLSPETFSIFHFRKDGLLSKMLKMGEPLEIELNKELENINGFNTIHAVANRKIENGKKVFIYRVYFAVEYGYTPVRFEHTNGREVVYSVNVTKLEKVADGLWYPASGRLGSTKENYSNVYEASRIIVNQGLTAEYFDIEFPPGTDVTDEISNKEYVFKPTEEQEKQQELKEKYLTEHADEIAMSQKLGGKVYSLGMLRKLGTAKGLYMIDNDKKFPRVVRNLKSYLDKETFSWLVNNVVFLDIDEELAKNNPAQTPFAYDKTFLKKGEGTNVLYNDGHVSFEKAETLKELGITTEETLARQILTSGYVLSVPADWARLKEIISEDKSKPLIITSEKLEELLAAASNTPGAKMLVTPAILTNDGEVGEIRMENAQDLKSLNIKNTVGADGKTVTLEFDFKYSTGQDMVASVSNKATLLSGQAIAVSGGVSENKAIVLLVKTEIQEKQFPETGVVAADAMEGEIFRIQNIDFEPIRQGKNVVWITVENKSDKEQLFAIHIYTRSVDYGQGGVGWGTRFFEKLKPNETKRTKFVYKIQGPVTDNTYIRVKFYDPATEEQYNYDKPFATRMYKSSDLRRKAEEKPESISTKDLTEIIIGNFTKVQMFIENKKYEQAWEFFTEDYQKAEYQTGGFERFEKAMEPKNPLDSAFTWEKSQFLKLEPKHLDKNANNNSVTLSATYKKETWKISFSKEGDEWKIDDIVGYQPRILDLQEADNK